MEETEGFLGVPILDAKAGADDSGDIGRDCDRDARKGEHLASQGGLLEKVAVEDSEGKEAHEGADTAAGFGYLKLHHRKLNDVALLKNRHAQVRQDLAGEPGCHELQREGDLIEDRSEEHTSELQSHLNLVC